MPGERFSLLYARPGDLASDSARARHRIGTLFRESIFNGHLELLAAYLGRNVGILLPGDGKYPSTWHQFVRECGIADFLDAVTVVYRYFFWHVSEETAIWWREAVRKIFAEEHLAYQIDDIGGVHPRIDEEFQRNIGSTIAALKSDRYRAVRELLSLLRKQQLVLIDVAESRDARQHCGIRLQFIEKHLARHAHGA